MDPPAMSCPDGCYRVYYYIYLVKTDSQEIFNMEMPVYFTNLSITGTLFVTPDNLSVVGARLSEVNVSASMACSPEFPGLNDPGISNSPILNYDPNTNLFAYQVSANNSSPVLNWPIYGRLLLFVMAVDVFPDETVSFSGLSCDMVLTESDGDNPEICSLSIQAGCETTPNLSKTIALPAAACTNATNGPPYIRIGTGVYDPQPGFPNRRKVPVWISGSTSTNFEFSEIDFLIGVAADPAGMQIPRIEKGLIDSASVSVYPAGAEYRLYVHAGDAFDIVNNGSGPDEDNILFFIVLDGPQLESECLDMTLIFPDAYGRIDGGMFSCCAPNFGSSQIEQWDADNCVKELCPEVTLIVEDPGGQQFNCNGIAFFDLKVAATANTGITDLRCVMEVKKTGEYSLLTSGTGAIYSPYCIPASDCITLTEVSPHLLRIEFVLNSISSLTVGPTAGSPKLLVNFALIAEDGGCIEGITVRDGVILKDGEDEECLISWESDFDPANVADDICGGSINISAETENGDPIEAWEYYVNHFPAGNGDFPDLCYQTGNSLGEATATACVCSDTFEQNVALRKVDNALNGVTTYDMVLFSKHILGLDPLTGFKVLAGDANMNGSLTTSDIVVIRRLILGLDTAFSETRSWRFIDKDLRATVQASSYPFPLIHAFPSMPSGSNNNGGATYSTISAPNRFADEEFEEFSSPSTLSLDSKADFVGFKVGDANGTAIANSLLAIDDRNADAYSLGMSSGKGKAGKSLEIPVFCIENQDLSGWQLALGYDASQLEVSGVRWPADIPVGAAENRDWNLVKPGELRVLWFDAARANAFALGTPIFFVQLRLLRDLPAVTKLFELRNQDIPSEAYRVNGQLLDLNLQVSDMPVLPFASQAVETPQPYFAFGVYPNPASAHFRLNIEASEDAAARLLGRNMLGVPVFERSLDLQTGMNTVPSTQLPGLPSGQYFISLYTSSGVENLRFIRQ